MTGGMRLMKGIFATVAYKRCHYAMDALWDSFGYIQYCSHVVV